MRYLKTSLIAMILSVLAPLGHAELKKDIEFAKPAGTSQTLDAFVPEGDGPFPTCILVHGGGFTRGDKNTFITPLFEPLSKAGFTWFTINYRLAPAFRFPANVEDTETAIRWVKAHAAEYKVDPNRIALIGESAGGHIVALAGTRANGDTSVAAVVPFYAPLDLELQVKLRKVLGTGLEALFGVTQINDATLKVLREASPSSYLRADLPPYLLIHGDQDDIVPHEQSVQFQQKMQAIGARCDLITIKGGAHGMGKWKPDYQEEMIAWLRKTLAP